MSYENERLLDQRISEMLTKAADEPSVSDALVERWAVRAAGIERGRAAERTLADTGTALTAAQQTDLAASGVIGRLMLNQMPPKGVTLDMMETQLKAQPTFRAAAQGSREQVVRDLRSGAVFRRIAGNRAPEAGAADAQRTRTAGPDTPEKKAPSIDKNDRVL